MGFSLKKIGNTVARVAGGALGFSLSGGNPAGAVMGGNLANTVLGAVGLSSDQIATSENLSAQKELASYAAARQNELNEAAFQRNLQQWNLENEYNSPEAQMQRYIKAGLNPNLIYDQQNLSANSPELKPATYNPGEYNPVDRSALRQQLQLALLEHAQRVENQAIQNDLARQELALRIKASEREDKKLDLLRSRFVSLTGSSDTDNLNETLKRLRIQKLEKELEDKPISELLEDFVTSKAKSFIGKTGNKIINKGVNTILDSVLGKGLSYTKF